MSMNDLLSDCLTRVRNGQMARHQYITAYSSKLVAAVLKVMKEQGYIKDYVEFADGNVRYVKVDLSYYNGKGVIKTIRRVSKPGCRIYTAIAKLGKFKGGLGIRIISTPAGVLSDREAHERNVGGEILCEIF
jgi:small subunit ribosomal protein S8